MWHATIVLISTLGRMPMRDTRGPYETEAACLDRLTEMVLAVQAVVTSTGHRVLDIEIACRLAGSIT